MTSKRPTLQAVHDAVCAVADWLLDEAIPPPDRPALALAVRLTARALAAAAPGGAVEVRIPPYVAVQCISGPRHSRGTPPNVVETDARTWLQLAAGLLRFEDAAAEGRIALSGTRAMEIAGRFPLVSITERRSD